MKRFNDFTRRSVSASFAGLILLLLSCGTFSTTARAQATGVSPILECVTSAFSEPGRSRVYFGYRNTTNDPQFLESGSAANYFTPVPNDRDQPSTFQAGEHRAVFYVEVAFSVTTSLTWNLGGSTENEPGHFVTATAASPQCRTDVITYQGRLTASGGQASGNYDFQFQIFDAATGGGATSALVSAANVNVSNGVFTVPLDFGVSTLRTPRAQYLEIGVRVSGSGGAYTTLAPRQALTDAPSAVFAARAETAGSAETAGRADYALKAQSIECISCITSSQISSIDGAKITGTVANATNATNAANATNSANSASLGGTAAANYLLKNGDGSGLTNLPVRLLPWETVTTATQAQANYGYVAANDAAQVVITLPANPAVGDIVRVTGAGAGGWRIAQNANQSIGGANLSGLPNQWTARESGRNWQSVASSADGAKLVAVVYNGQIYTSIDSGATWTARESSRVWSSVASSADGTKLVAVVSGGQIYTSTDSGATWTARASGRNWYSVASSADGAKLVAVVLSGQIYTSTDSGATWTARESSRVWSSVASSADGTKLVAVVYSGQIYTSTDSGATWTARESNRNWYSVASSADGAKLVAVVLSGQIYTSIDSGATWTARESGRNWYSVASSADGAKLVAVVNGGQIYTSTDSGATWTARESSRNWYSAASSADGAKLVAVEYGGQIYTAAFGTSSSGTAGYLTGGQNSAIELQYIGGGRFIVLSSQGTINNF